MNVSPSFNSRTSENNNKSQVIAKDSSSKSADSFDGILPLLVIIDNRALDRECLAHGLNNHSIEMSIATFSSFEQWQHQRRGRTVRAVLFNIGGQKCWFSRGTEPVFSPRIEPPSSMFFRSWFGQGIG
ncbi:hypothetical protein VBH83_19365, partial [Ochrobactrum sp. S1502_03]